jgi:hypothetical protein
MARASNTTMSNVLICSIVVISMSGVVRLSAQTPVNTDAQILAAFGERVKQYAALRDKVDGGAARQTQTDDPAKLDAQRKALAANIQKQRAGAKAGDIFTPDVQPLFKRLLKPALKGADGADNAKAIKEEKPVVALKVNAPYPQTQPLSMVPPDVLKQLPPLPKDIEYRFVQRHLILFDARATLIIDVLPNAIP